MQHVEAQKKGQAGEKERWGGGGGGGGGGGMGIRRIITELD